MHTKHGSSQSGHPTYCAGSDCSGYRGLWMVDRDENEKGNGWRRNETRGRGLLSADHEESPTDLNIEREFLFALTRSAVSARRIVAALEVQEQLRC